MSDYIPSSSSSTSSAVAYFDFRNDYGKFFSQAQVDFLKTVREIINHVKESIKETLENEKKPFTVQVRAASGNIVYLDFAVMMNLLRTTDLEKFEWGARGTRGRITETLKSFVKLQVTISDSESNTTSYHVKFGLLHVALMYGSISSFRRLMEWHARIANCAPWRYNCTKKDLKKKPYLYQFNLFNMLTERRVPSDLLTMLMVFDCSGCFTHGKRDPKLEKLVNNQGQNIFHLAAKYYFDQKEFIFFVAYRYPNLFFSHDKNGRQPYDYLAARGCFAFPHYAALDTVESNGEFEEILPLLKRIWSLPRDSDYKKIFRKTQRNFCTDLTRLRFLTPAYGWPHALTEKHLEDRECMFSFQPIVRELATKSWNIDTSTFFDFSILSSS